ncbi:pentatricopeptide repeat-containing protein At2g13600-like [Phoenix dactylifera]|uniref:Pentatricopeptide repeat-containing protein At2g13600-like n=1 Tax=Phoenix dactylifera TaxID=42345 RepID=A0A8B8J4J7_PHODC|nr:pentatricopeptide repeat-containing protein At2g13600-like [Phoenix dactylifera]XP_026660385.2 pentatricopeptide repeat-containing protein At2g13600-like [Phoenix dactylifera]XP_026660386.2 pentatricopeptide repeat-containing protein At2g13600-like [Phoenix dactylifera]XP_026660387.2 pentatricopeptide repeat-containing protein At2g13600-like [Phoenix dactylifera]XP_026660388.2 pentatricopeptide repeat-containing protein At2g13600-like [Phoenix dactylifera]XP_026660389.2 pentatricopeptide re
MNLHHARLLKLGLDRDPVTATQLLTAYASLPSPDSLTYALRLFAQVPSRSRDPVLWTALLSAFARSTRPAAALRLFSRLPSLRSNPFAFASAARAAAYSDPRLARALHAQAIQHGFHSNVVVATSILRLYSKINDVDSSCKVFGGMPQRNVITWNSMIAGYTSAGMGVRALDLFYRMRCTESGLDVDEFTVASGLTACAAFSDLRSGTQIHGFLITLGHETDTAVINALANMYFRCGEVECAERAMQGREEFVESKLMMIKGYVFNKRYYHATKSILGHGGGFMELVMVDHSVIVSMLKVCAGLGLLKTGRQVHGLLVASGLYENCCSSDGNDAILGSALIDMYCKCSSITEAQHVFSSMGERHVPHWNSMITGCIYNGLINEAHQLFNAMPDKNVISWTAMISGYVQHGLPSEGLRLLARLYGESGSIRGNCFTLAKSLDACSCLAALHSGKEIHAQALRTMAGDGDDHVVIKTALIDMYSKSGNLNYARRIFDRMEIKNVVSWTSMITGYAVHGLGLQAIGVFEQMIRMGFEPNEVTFIAVLSACSHCSLVEQGINYFNLMTERYGIAPRVDHYTCLVDMLGRAGKLAEAWKLVEDVKDAETNCNKDRGMESGEGASIWGALLGGCGLHGNVEIGSEVARKMLERKQQISDTYVALSNVYAAAEMWDEVYRVREDWRKQGVSREAGHSQIQIGALI